MKKPTLVIALEGGLLSAICTDIPVDFEDIVVIDYDTEGADEADITWVKQRNGCWSDALVSHWGTEQLTLPMEFSKELPEGEEAL